MNLRQYIGKPWMEGAQGPHAFDCYALVRDIQQRYFGIDMSEVAVPDYEDQGQIAELLSGHIETGNWIQVDKPQHGDGVYMRRPARHYGVWLDIDGGGVLHCTKDLGVKFVKDSAWHAAGYGRKVYLRHKSKI